MEGGCVKVPRIIEERDGQFLSIVYFEFVDLNVREGRELPERESLVILGKILRELSEVGEGAKLRDKEICFMMNYSDVQHYREGLEFLELMIDEISASEVADIEDLRGKVGNIFGELVFSHGDLVADNYSTDGWLWDWDRCGFYPVCFDMSWAVLNTVKFSCFEELMEINADLIRRCYQGFGSESELLKNAVIFSLIFYCRKFKPSKDDKIFKEMCDYLREVA